ncbi:dihydroneopterin aldolase [Helicobacter sp. 16-1353]|uniref:dihydroneopterin aldolase n=1 Tax=Helicobacter sp. 16-1353 TaxID=2004996 RepID=UPI0015EF489B|nr:dihydroneopterin aldolase [Helicobacter sp. 16-1353]
MDNVFKISIHNFKINTIIGILPKERETAQDIILDLDILYIKKEILDYSHLYNLIIDIFNKNHFFYLEDALCFVIDSIILHFKNITYITLSIKKPHIFTDCIVSVSKELDLQKVKND